MAKRATDGGPRVELFPFLSILACVIGTIFLMITGLVLGQVGKKPDDEGLARSREFADIRKRKASDDEERRTLAASLEEARRRLEELRKLQAELERLKAAKDPAAELEAERQRLRAAEADVEKLVAELLKDYAEYTNRSSRLSMEIDRRNAVPTKSLLKIQPTGGGSLAGMRPAFVETAKDGLILHDRQPVKKVPASQIATDADFAALLKKVAADPKSLLVLLIRSDGIGAYRAARQAAEAQQARVGKLPLPGDGTIDLSAFANR